MPLPQLRRVRWAVRAALTLGVAASVAANILHARPNPISQVIAAWPPLALLLTVELISRVPVHRRSLAAVRLAATSAIAGIAAWVSYWHMTGVATRYGETGASPYLLPLSVDGLVIVASVSLVELAGRIRATEPAERVERVEPAEPVSPAPVISPAVAGPERSPARRTGQPRTAKTAPSKAAPTKTTAVKTTAAKAAPRKHAAAMATPVDPPPVEPAERAERVERVLPRPGRELSPAEMAALAAQLKADQPDLTQAAIAAQLGITTHRLRQLNRI